MRNLLLTTALCLAAYTASTNEEAVTDTSEQPVAAVDIVGLHDRVLTLDTHIDDPA